MKSLESKVFLIVRAYNAQKHERRPIDEIENGTEFSQIHFSNDLIMDKGLHSEGGPQLII